MPFGIFMSLSLTILFLTACTDEADSTKTKSTIVDHKIDAIKEAKQSVAATNEKTQTVQSVTATQTQSVNASGLYTLKCASCHGTNAQKKALNTSADISQWDTQKIQNALQGYKNGTYGGKMKAIMQAQSKPLSDEEIKQLSEYITTL